MGKTRSALSAREVKQKLKLLKGDVITEIELTDADIVIRIDDFGVSISKKSDRSHSVFFEYDGAMQVSWRKPISSRIVSISDTSQQKLLDNLSGVSVELDLEKNEPEVSGFAIPSSKK